MYSKICQKQRGLELTEKTSENHNPKSMSTEGRRKLRSEAKWSHWGWRTRSEYRLLTDQRRRWILTQIASNQHRFKRKVRIRSLIRTKGATKAPMLVVIGKNRKVFPIVLCIEGAQTIILHFLGMWIHRETNDDPRVRCLWPPEVSTRPEESNNRYSS